MPSLEFISLNADLIKNSMKHSCEKVKRKMGEVPGVSKVLVRSTGRASRPAPTNEQPTASRCSWLDEPGKLASGFAFQAHRGDKPLCSSGICWNRWACPTWVLPPFSFGERCWKVRLSLIASSAIYNDLLIHTIENRYGNSWTGT